MIRQIRSSVFPSSLVFLAILGVSMFGQSAAPLRYESPAAERFNQWRRTELPSRKVALREPLDFRLGPLTADERALLAKPSPKGLPKAGLHRAFTTPLETAGKWEKESLWRMVLHSEAATGMRVHFRNFHAGNGRVWIHDGIGDGAQVFGPYTGDGIFGDGEFWSDLVSGEHLYLEFEPAAESAGRPRELPFEIAEVSHLVTVLDSSKASGPKAAASCELDVSCYSDWADMTRAVGRYSFESDGSTYVCSGTLLNTTNDSKIPYFLTADHCISTATEARSVTVFWAYKTASCNGAVPSTRNLERSTGSTYMGGINQLRGDGTLLRLNTIPSGVTFAGWTADAPELGNRVTGIHHPAGDYMRISFGTLRTARTSGGRQADTFWGSFWDGGGLTEGGSSGSGLFLSDGRLIGQLSHGPKFDSEAEYCSALPFADNYGKFSTVFPVIRDFLAPGSGGGSGGGGGTTGGTLTSGQAANFRIGPVDTGTLFRGESGFKIDVPSGATRLEIRLATSTSGADVDLYARAGQDVTVENGRVVADFSSEGPAGDESIVITPTSSPALTAGTYFIGMALFTRGVTAEGTVTATVTTGGGGGGGNSGNRLTSGNPRTFQLGPVSNASLYRGENGFTIEVPQGATGLDIRLTTTPTSVDVDLYARAGQDVGLSEEGRPIADHKSEGDFGDESISVNAPTPGVYFIAFGLFTRNATANCTITATVRGGTTNPPTTSPAVALVSGQARNFTVQPVENPTLLGGSNAFRIDVPAGATRLDIRLQAPQNPNADLDLYVKYGQETRLVDGRPQPDHASEGDRSDESISISATSTPTLRAGTYFINFGVFTTGTTINATITATVVTGSTTPPPATGGNVLTSGQPRTYNLPAVDSPRLFRGENGYVINVPQGATSLEVKIVTPNRNVDVDLFVRGGLEAEIQGGSVVADGAGTGPDGNETVVLSGSGLRPGPYYISLAMFTPGVAATGTLTATISTGTNPPPTQTGPQTLVSGVASPFRIGPITSGGALFSGNSGFRVTVPQGATRLEIRLVTQTANADVDLYARFNADVEVTNGNALYDHLSDSLTGLETIVITPTSNPPLKVGTYFVGLGLFTNNVQATGTVTATLSVPGAPTQGAGTTLTPGVPTKFSVGPASSPTLFNGPNSFKVVVPSNGSKLEVKLISETPGVDTDLYLRYEQDTEIDGRQVIADFESTSYNGHETIALETPVLKAGTYYVTIALYTPGAVARGSLLATLARTSTSSAPASEIKLEKQPLDNPEAQPISRSKRMLKKLPVTGDIPVVVEQ